MYYIVLLSSPSLKSSPSSSCLIRFLINYPPSSSKEYDALRRALNVFTYYRVSTGGSDVGQLRYQCPSSRKTYRFPEEGADGIFATNEMKRRDGTNKRTQTKLFPVETQSYDRVRSKLVGKVSQKHHKSSPSNYMHVFHPVVTS